MYKKRLKDVTCEDIHQIVSDQMQEDAELELKESLPTKNKVRDTRTSDATQVSEFARNKLLEEIIAFANAYGGTLIIGIGESNDKPARADRIVPLSNCTQLAEILCLQCRDCIEPQIPLLEVKGIPLQEDGGGVIVFRVPRSQAAPHRHTVTKECYVRRTDRTEKMTLREIQDLTLQVKRGLVSLDEKFVNSRKKFTNILDKFAKGNRAFGIRATLVSLTPVCTERVHNRNEVLPPMITMYGSINDDKSIELDLPASDGIWQPQLRGTKTISDQNGFVVIREVYCDGLIEYTLLVKDYNDQIYLSTEWLIGLIGNVLCAVEKFRRAIEVPSVEYELEFELDNRAGNLPIRRYGKEIYNYEGSIGPHSEGSTVFPRYRIGAPNEFEIVTDRLEQDFWDVTGRQLDNRIRLDFESALRDLGLS